MILKKFNKLILFVFFVSSIQLYGQETIYNGNPDTSFETARNLAFNEHRKDAQDTLRNILTKYPNYYEIRTFLATTYSWDGDYKKARTEFSYILEKDSKNKNNWIPAINNELWAETPFTALELSNKALEIFPNDSEILILKASAQENTNNLIEALKIVESILDKDPDNQKAKDFNHSLNEKLRNNTVGIRSEVDFYSDTFDPMQYHTLKYSRLTKYGTIIAKLNFSRRYNENGTQFEMDLYPKITKGLYAYVNIGFANTFLFPDLRYGGELYKSLPHSFEISAGFRTLKYDTTTNIYTGSIGLYIGNNYWSFRPYFTPGDGGTSTSGALNYRRYRSNANNYIGLTYSMGYSPEIDRFNFAGNENAIINLKSQRFNLGYYFTTNGNHNAWGAQFDISHQEKSFDTGNYFWIYGITLSWDIKFK